VGKVRVGAAAVSECGEEAMAGFVVYSVFDF